jgi:hypothetical protein
MKQILRGARTLGPYLLTEALLPGGTLIALGMWLYQNKDRVPGLLGRAKSDATPPTST